MLKPLDWLRQAWKSLVTKLSKPIVVFLDDEPSQVREVFLKLFDITEPVNTTTEHFCITNISRDGKKLDRYVVRTSDIHPHFYRRDCFNDAMAYGDSDFIGDYTVDMNWLRISPDGELLPTQVIDWGMTATEHMKICEDFCRRADNGYIGELK